MRLRPSRCSRTRCARRSSRRCLEMAGRETGKAPAISPAGWLPRRSKSRTARRVGSARAWKVAPGEYVTERFRIVVTIRLRVQHVKGKTSGRFSCRQTISLEGKIHKATINGQESASHTDRGRLGERECRRKVRGGRWRP